MKSSCLFCVAALSARAVFACQQEHKHEFHAHRALSKRQEAVFPPVLTQDESVLVGSIDNNTIEEWWVARSVLLWKTNFLTGLTTTLMDCT